MSPNAIDVTPNNRVDAFFESCVCDDLAYEDDPHPRRMPDIGPDESWDDYQARTKAEFDAIVADLFPDFDPDDIALMYAGNEVYVADPLAAPCTPYTPDDEPDARRPGKSVEDYWERVIEPGRQAAADEAARWAEAAHAEQAEAARAELHETLVTNRLDMLRANDEAQRRFDAERRPPVELPPVRSLTDLLAEDDTEPDYLVNELAPSGGKVMINAQGKAGKTTLSYNLVRTLADGGLFLGRFAIRPGSHRVVLIDNELPERVMRKWLREHGIRNTAAVADTVNLRGRAGLFNILDDQVRAMWAERLRQTGCTVLIFDCLRPVFDALGLSEDKDGGVFLTALDELAHEAGIGELFVIHHMGHTGERSRGDSRFIDWPDATWKLLLKDPEDKSSARYFSAYGRDVDVTEGRLDYDPAARSLTYVADGSRKRDRVAANKDDARQNVLAILADDHRQHGDDAEMSTKAIKAKASELYSMGGRRVTNALTALGPTVEDDEGHRSGGGTGALANRPGARGATLWRINRPCQRCHLPVADLLVSSHPNCAP